MTSLTLMACPHGRSRLQTIFIAGGLLLFSTGLQAAFITRAAVVQFGSVGQSNTISYNGVQSGGSVDNFTSCGGTINAGGTATSSFARASCGSQVSSGSADLVTATLHGSTNSSATAGALGYSTNTFQDSITFSNTTGGNLLLSLTWTVEGNTTFGTEVDISSYIDLQGVSGHLFLQGSTATVLADHITFSDLRGSQGATIGEGSATWNVTGVNSPVGRAMQSTLVIPPGMATAQIQTSLVVDCRFGAYCDFGNTGKFAFGSLPAGLSFTSDSGVFLSGAPATVPEPGTWAMFSIGLISAGILRRRSGNGSRRRRVVSV